MSVLNWVTFSGPTSWDHANAVAHAAGGRLFVDDHDFAHGLNWGEALADSVSRDALDEAPTWFGISAVAGGGYRFVNGKPVDPAWAAQKFNGEDPNADADPTNDIAHPVILGSRWTSPDDPAF